MALARLPCSWCDVVERLEICKKTNLTWMDQSFYSMDWSFMIRRRRIDNTMKWSLCSFCREHPLFSSKKFPLGGVLFDHVSHCQWWCSMRNRQCSEFYGRALNYNSSSHFAAPTKSSKKHWITFADSSYASDVDVSKTNSHVWDTEQKTF